MRFLIKLFRTSNSDNVNECQTCFEFKLPGEIILTRTVLKFTSKLPNVDLKYGYRPVD